MGSRHGGGRENYVLPDDDAGRQDLSILLQHYARSNPIKIPKIIKLRAPWMGEDEIALLLDQIVAYPRQWKAETLGRELRVTAAEWRALNLKTIAPSDMTIEERKQERKLRNCLRMRLKRRTEGRQSRAEYEADSKSRNKPWLAAGMSRTAWYRQQTKVKSGQAAKWDKCVSHKDSLNAGHRPVPPSKPPIPKGIDGKNDSAATSVPEVYPAEVCLAA